MKTTWIASKKRGLIPIILAALIGLASQSCEEELPPPPPPPPPIEGDDLSTITFEDFWVGQEGILVNTLNGSVTLEFPAEAVTEKTHFRVTKSQYNCMYREPNLMNCSITLESKSPGEVLKEPVLLKLTYCLSDFHSATAVNEEDITIYRIDINGYAHSIGDCTVDNIGKMVSGYIDECGKYVVGEY